MNAEQTVRAMMTAINNHDVTTAASYTTDDLTVNEPSLPRPVGKTEFLAQMGVMLRALPDWTYEIQALSVAGDQVTVTVQVNATHTRPLQLPGLPLLPASGKQIHVKDRFVYTVRDSKIARIDVDSPADGGAASMLRQLGVKLPPA